MFTERDLESLDPLKLDREIRLAASALGRDARGLGSGAGLEPLVLPQRLVATRTAFQAVSQLVPADPLREPLRRWVYRIAEYRIDRGAMVAAAQERYVAPRVVSEPERAKLPLSSMLGLALSEPRRQDAWLASFLRSSEPLGDREALVWERRAEVAARMGLPGPSVIETPGTTAMDAARLFLDGTRDLLAEALGRRRGSLLDVALGRGAAGAFPRHLLPRTILDLFRDTGLFRGLSLDPGELPAAYGPASFVRALLRVGAAWVDATAPADQPFVIARDPYGLRRRTFGALFGALPGTAAFGRHALGLDSGQLAAHLRELTGIFVVGARLSALRVLLRGPALEGRRALRSVFEDATREALGVALPSSAALSIVRLSVDDVQRFAGLLLAATFAMRLRDEYDDDWYRNPRAVERLRDEARLSPVTTTTDAELAGGVQRAVAFLTEGLG